MKRILAISGSRADYGLLDWTVNVLATSFDIELCSLKAATPETAFEEADDLLCEHAPDCVLILGDRWEILQAAIAAHLRRVPIAHIAGGDITLGSYDHQMRDCISMLAEWHFPTSDDATRRLIDRLGRVEVYNIGNIALDYIMHGDWKRERPYERPYVVVSYQPETADGTIDWDAVRDAIAGRYAAFLLPNNDHGSEHITSAITRYSGLLPCEVLRNLPRGEYLNLLAHCEEFIGNSSSMLYEAPALGIKCTMIGNRQDGRVAPAGDGKAAERIREVLCRCL